MEKRILYKFTFLIIVALLIIAMYVWKWSTDDAEQQKPEDLFDASQHETEQLPALQEEKIDEVLGTKPNSNADETQNDTEDKVNQQTTEDQHETTYQKQFGEKAVTTAKEQAKEGLALYLAQITDWDKWDGVVTNSFLEEIKQAIPAVKEANVERGIESIELFASDTSQSNNMVFGAFATWHVTSNGRVTNQRTQLFYLTMVQQNDQWLVNNLVTPDEGMEGKKDK
ncbi:hypothetical protein [Lentibacillus amyloliquefaciens]|uniref:Tim44-like domain-containing protein n=1 Tax=Lentibacillus amyloliquefaciens TaxID=1472767 RepID=A0A0U3WCL8_9BACI|nr:hypothetical protein [Lentibacillus amyloliquefaciens]ALX47551.1 hypothetical protein AOX59_02380 [Lentibacillus amyloliquefaciens]